MYKKKNPIILFFMSLKKENPIRVTSLVVIPIPGLEFNYKKIYIIFFRCDPFTNHMVRASTKLVYFTHKYILSSFMCSGG